MADLPHPWAIYARLQNSLSNNNQVGDRSWGTEAAMNFVLTSASDALSEHDVEKIVATGRRRERHRIARREPLIEDFPTVHPEAALMARSELAAIRRKVGVGNWDLLAAVGAGSSYNEISAAMAVPQGLARVKIMRLRTQLAQAA
ncbi:hypothetical protein [Bradyrhizobium sp.]|jgi:hypothetical protein|uniref:hypothetical protein n=1 Tax=Bradyrhizobium sp. TaxID=376 RepID=UPI002E04F891|nr:hypothetical protein [Bradyrhizobium sp.]